MKAHSLKNTDKCGTLYVMKLQGLASVARVGAHSTSNKVRAAQVSKGLGRQARIVWSTNANSKAHALALEAIAHYFLGHYERKIQLGGRRFQGFRCTNKVAIDACVRAIKVLNGKRVR